MAEAIYRSSVVSNLLENRRRKRAISVLSKVDTWNGMRILDIGCGRDGRSFENYVSNDFMITGIDIEEPETVHVQHPGFQYFKQDARDLSRFKSKEFDLSISFGMFEHICDRSVLERIISEMIRVSRQWVVVVPWKYCWIEPHFKFPFFQLLPMAIKIRLTKLLNLHGLRHVVASDPDWIRKYYQWLPSSEWKRLCRADSICVSKTLDTIEIIKSR